MYSIYVPVTHPPKNDVICFYAFISFQNFQFPHVWLPEGAFHLSHLFFFYGMEAHIKPIVYPIIVQ